MPPPWLLAARRHADCSPAERTPAGSAMGNRPAPLRSVCRRARRAPRRAAASSRRTHTRAGSRRAESLEGFTLGDGKDFRDVVQATESTAAEIDSACAVRPARLRLRGELLQAAAQGVVDQLPKGAPLRLLQAGESRGYVIVQGESRAHTSLHSGGDALMSTDQDATSPPAVTPTEVRRAPPAAAPAVDCA